MKTYHGKLATALAAWSLASLACFGAVSCGSSATMAPSGALGTSRDTEQLSHSGAALSTEDACTVKQGVFETLGLYQGSKDELSGSVTLAISGDELVVTVAAGSGLSLKETHLYVGETAPVSATPALFTYNHSLSSPAASDAYTVPLVGLGGHIDSAMYIALFATFEDGGSTATAWNADCRQLFPGNDNDRENSRGWKSYCDFQLPGCEITAPLSVTASDLGYGHIRLAWTAADGASAYQIWRSTSEDGVYAPVGSSAGTSFEDTLSAPGTYWYQVRGMTSTATGAFSTPVAGNVTGSALVAPAGTTSTDRGGTVHLTWLAVTGAVGYQIFRSTTEGGTYSPVGSTTQLFFDDTVPAAGSYWYQIRAIDGGGNLGPFSAPVAAAASGALAAPTGVDTTDNGGTIHLTWPAVPGASGYQIFRSNTEGGVYSVIGSTTALFFDDTVPAAGSYWYKIRAVDGNNNPGSFSAPISGDASGTVPSAPLNLQASDGTYPDHIQISWSAVAGATSYQLYRAFSEAGTYSLVASTTQLTVDHTSGNTFLYWYKVKASNANGDSVFSGTDSGHASVASPSTVRASDGDFIDRVRVTWAAVPGGMSYSVFRSSTENGPFSLIGTTTDTELDDFVIDGNIYWYRLTTSAASGESYYSQSDSGFKQ
jgi:fibronectin type 3 domain-containing protein